MRDVVIVSGARTPVGAFGGGLKSTPVVQLGALVLKEALKKAGLRPQTGAELQGFEPDALKGLGLTDLEKKAYDYDASLQPVQIDEVIMGNVLPAAQGQNTARQSLIGAGIPLRLKSIKRLEGQRCSEHYQKDQQNSRNC
jgi:acetyl-CoA C-acetyltransferase